MDFHPPVQRKLSQKEVILQAFLGHDFQSGEDAHRDGQVEPGPFLFHVGRREIDGDSFGREIIAGVLDGRLHPVFGLLDRPIRQAHRGENREALNDVHLHFDDVGIDSQNGTAQDFGQHAKVLIQN